MQLLNKCKTFDTHPDNVISLVDKPVTLLGYLDNSYSVALSGLSKNELKFIKSKILIPKSTSKIVEEDNRADEYFRYIDWGKNLKGFYLIAANYRNFDLFFCNKKGEIYCMDQTSTSESFIDDGYKSSFDGFIKTLNSGEDWARVNYD